MLSLCKATHCNTLISSDWSSLQLAFIHVIQEGTERVNKKLYMCLGGAHVDHLGKEVELL